MSLYDERAVLERYGGEPNDDEEIIAYLKALKVIVAADGEISSEELIALRKGMKRLGVSDGVVRMIEAFDVRGVSLEQVLPSLRPGGKLARFLLRDAVEVCRADGSFPRDEKAAVAEAARLLGLSADAAGSA